MTILALDLGTHAGWALRRPDGRIESGVQHFEAARHAGEGLRFIRFRSWLHDLKRQCETRGEPLSAIYYERKDFVQPRQVIATRISFGLWAHLVAWAEHHGIYYQGVAIGSIKASICGSGKAKKPEIIKAVRARGFSPADHNEADALALLLMGDDRGRAAA